MSDATCKTCPYCDWIDEDDGTSWTVCRKHAPLPAKRARVGAWWPAIDEHTDWCGSHPDRQPHFECATTTLVGRETLPTESDMRRIVDALEKMAMRGARVKM